MRGGEVRKLTFVSLILSLVACTSPGTKSRDPSSIFGNKGSGQNSAPIPVERITLVVSHAENLAITRAVYGGQQLRFQSCAVSESDLSSNQTMLLAVNRHDARCENLNSTSFEAQNEQVMEALNTSYRDNLVDILKANHKDYEFRVKVGGYMMSTGAAAVLGGIAISHYGNVRKSLMIENSGALIGFAGLGLGFAYVAMAPVETHYFMTSKPVTLETALAKMIQEQNLTSSSQIGFEKLFYEMQSAIEKATAQVFSHFYST